MTGNETGHHNACPDGAGPEPPDAFSLALNGLPLAVIAGGVLLAGITTGSAAGGVAVFAAWLFLAPPLACRLLLLVFGRPQGRFAQATSGYRVWWTATQLQMPFNRLPWLEDALRLVPGLYPLWIGLWGGNFSARSFAAPGSVIADRWLLEVGPGAVLGIQSTLVSHMALRDERGRWIVAIAAPVVEAHAIVGGQAAMGPGSRLRTGALLPAGRRLAPFSTFPRDRAPGKGTDDEESGLPDPRQHQLGDRGRGDLGQSRRSLDGGARPGLVDRGARRARLLALQQHSLLAPS